MKLFGSARPAAFVPGSSAGSRFGVRGCRLCTGKSGGPSRPASRSEHQRAVPRPSDIADGLPRSFALAVYTPLIARRSAPKFALYGASKKKHPHGLRLRVLCVMLYRRSDGGMGVSGVPRPPVRPPYINLIIITLYQIYITDILPVYGVSKPCVKIRFLTI